MSLLCLKPTRGYHFIQSQSKALKGPACLVLPPWDLLPVALLHLPWPYWPVLMWAPLLRAFAHAIPTSLNALSPNVLWVSVLTSFDSKQHPVRDGLSDHSIALPITPSCFNFYQSPYHL